MKKRITLFFCVVVIFVNATLAQNGDGWDWGDNPQKAKEQYTLLGDDIKAKNFTAAKVPLIWLLAGTPKLNKALYMRGADVYEALVTVEKEEGKKKVYQDSALLMYDLRVKYFQDEANVLNRKGYKALTYWQNRPEKQQELFNLYQKIVDLNGNSTFSQNIQNFMYLVSLQKKANKELTDDKVLDIYDKLSGIVKANEAKDAATWSKVQEYLDERLKEMVKIDCEFVKTKLGPKLKANPEDFELATEIYAFMIQGGCFTEDLFFDAALKLVSKEPTFQRYKTIALAYKKKGEDGNFDKFMNKAFELGGTPSEKAEFILSQAQEEAKFNKVAARATALKAASIDPSKASAAYSLIGYLYMNSGGECVTADKNLAPVYNKVAYLAAYEMFQKAGDGAGMAKAAQYFPSTEDVFTIGMMEKVGSQISVGCWIGGTATLRKK